MCRHQLEEIVLHDKQTHLLVDEPDVPGSEEVGLEGELPGRLIVFQRDTAPLNDHLLPVIAEHDCRVGRSGLEVAHQGSNVLHGGEPRVSVIAHVAETASRNGDLAEVVAVEGEGEAEFCSLSILTNNNQY